MAGTDRHDGKPKLSVHCREKRQAAKRLGKHHASSSEDDSDGAASDGEDSAEAGADGDPVFQMEADPFSDPFFQVSPSSQLKPPSMCASLLEGFGALVASCAILIAVHQDNMIEQLGKSPYHESWCDGLGA